MIRQRPSRINYDTKVNQYSGVAWMFKPSECPDTESLKWRLIKAFNDAIFLMYQQRNTLYFNLDFRGMDILDTSQDFDPILKTRHKMVKHFQEEITYPGWTFSSIDGNGNCVTTGYEKMNPVLVPKTSVLNPLGSYSIKAIRFAKSRANATMVPRVKQDMDLLVALIELPEVVELGLVLKSLANSTKTLNRYMGNTANGFTRKLGRGIDYMSLAAASLFLTHQLAIAPLVSDVLKLRELLATVETKYTDLLSRYNDDREHNHHYTEFLHSEDNLVRQEGQYTKGTSIGSKYTVKFHAQLSYRLVGPPDYLTFVKGVMDSTFSWNTLWEKVPFSFLLDYVFTISKTIGLLDRTYQLTHIQTDYLESVTQEWTAGTHFNDDVYLGVIMPVPSHMGKFSLGQNSLASGYRKRHYYRYPEWPYSGLVVPKLRVPNLRQSAIAVALAWVGLHKFN